MISTIKVECNLKTLMQVLDATGNSQVAMAILDGTYVEPNIYPTKVGRWETKKYNTVVMNDLGQEETVEMEEQIPVMYHFVSYNPFTGELQYYYNDSWKRTNSMSLEAWNNLEYPFNDADQAH
jgi:hypothetical protein